jgi:peroxiredoxin
MKSLRVASAVLFALGLFFDSAHSAGDRVRADSAGKTATLTLPARTNNAWDLQPIRLPDLDGTQRTLAEWSGKVLMLNFWASWCAPCQYEIPEFVAYQDQYAAQGLQVVGVGLDEARRLRNVARTLGINYPVMVIEEQAGAALMRQWGNDKGILPYTVVIDRDGHIRYIHRGRMDNYAFQQYVKPLLGS